MTRLKVAGALLFCSILSAGPAIAAQTIDVGFAARPDAVFAPIGNADNASTLFQRVPPSPMERMAAHDYRPAGKTPAASLAAPAEEMSGSVWLVGAGFGTIFLIAARRRRPDIQGV